jgi:hypothetical protein
MHTPLPEDQQEMGCPFHTKVSRGVQVIDKPIIKAFRQAGWVALMLQKSGRSHLEDTVVYPTERAMRDKIAAFECRNRLVAHLSPEIDVRITHGRTGQLMFRWSQYSHSIPIPMAAP